MLKRLCHSALCWLNAQLQYSHTEWIRCRGGSSRPDLAGQTGGGLTFLSTSDLKTGCPNFYNHPGGQEVILEPCFIAIPDVVWDIFQPQGLNCVLIFFKPLIHNSGPCCSCGWERLWFAHAQFGVSPQKPLKPPIASLFCNLTEAFYSFFFGKLEGQFSNVVQPQGESAFPQGCYHLLQFCFILLLNECLSSNRMMKVTVAFYPALESGFRNGAGPGQQPQLRNPTILNDLSILFYGCPHPVLPPLIQFSSLTFLSSIILCLLCFFLCLAFSPCLIFLLCHCDLKCVPLIINMHRIKRVLEGFINWLNIWA